MFRTATFKLTVWYLAIIMAISLMFSLVVYRLAADDIARGLHTQSERIYSQFPVFRNYPILRPNTDIDNNLHSLLLRLVIFNLVVLLFAGVSSYLLAKHTLEPIEEAHEQQKRFTADVSHELRTPLTAIRMESEVALLSDDTTKKELRETLNSNLEEVSKLENLINNILRLTRLEIHELRQNFSDVDTQKVAHDALEQVKKLAKARGIKIETKFISKPIEGDASSITQMLVVVLDNAIKYSPNDSAIEFTVSRKNQGLIFRIVDHGIGIAKEDLNHIFDRFYRASTSRSKAEENDGHGLGLSIAKLIADLHNCTITVSSQLEKGTTVDIYFPGIDSKA